MVCVACLPNEIAGIASRKAGGKDVPKIWHVLLPAYLQEVCTAGLHSGLHSLYLQIMAPISTCPVASMFPTRTLTILAHRYVSINWLEM